MFQYINYINVIIYSETVFVAQLFASVLPKRKGYPLRLLLTSVIGVALAFFFPLIPISNFWGKWAYSVFMYVYLLTLSFFSVVLCVKGRFTAYLFCAVGGYSLHHLAGTIDAIVRPFIFADYVGFSDPFYAMFHFAIVLVEYTLIVLFFMRNSKMKLLMSKKRVVVLTLVIILLNIVLSSLAMFTGETSSAMVISITDLYNLATSILAVYILSGMLEQEYLEKENEIINGLYKENIRQYEISRATLSSLHDLKHRINVVMDGKYALTESEKKDISDKIFIFDSIAKTGNDTLDIILTQKIMLCYQYGIEFDCIVDGEKLSFMDVYDLFSLFGNAIDNAIEAVRRQEEGKPRLISLTVKGTDQYVSVHLENTFNGQIKISDGIPETNKEDKISHGFGIRSMYNITNKYDGSMTITVNEDIFNLDIFFQR